jgi:hypothetical protein
MAGRKLRSSSVGLAACAKSSCGLPRSNERATYKKSLEVVISIRDGIASLVLGKAVLNLG